MHGQTETERVDRKSKQIDREKGREREVEC